MTDETARDSNKRLLKWLLPLLLLLLALFGIFAYLNHEKKDDDSVQQNKTAQATASTNSNAPLTDLNAILGTSDPKQIDGKTVDLTQTKAVSVIGDRSFTIGDNSKHVYALLDENLNNGTAEQAIKVTEGQTYHVTGVVKTVPTDTATLMQTFQLSQAQIDEIKTQGFYIAVSKLS